MGKRAIYSCITLQKELENTIKKIGFEGKVTYLNVALHSNPQKMHETLQRIIDENTEAEEIVICDIVNIGLHFFHKDVRLMLPLVVKHSIVAA